MLLLMICGAHVLPTKTVIDRSALVLEKACAACGFVVAGGGGEGAIISTTIE